MYWILRTFLATTGCLAALLVAGLAYADCGDNVAGTRVACGCGDVVVSDTRLQSSDPVVQERCLGDGLLLRAGSGASGILLDLGGNTINGTGIGTGIRVVDGGDEGAVIVGGDGGQGTVSRFGTGLRAHGRSSLREIRDVVFQDNERDGMVVRGSSPKLVSVVTKDNGRDGVRVGGRDASLEDVQSSGNERYGVHVTGSGARVGMTGSNNGKGDTLIRGQGNVEDAAEVAP